MLRFPTIAAFVLGGFVGATIVLGLSAARFAREGQLKELSVLEANLAADRQLTPQLREYLKARLYYTAMSLEPKQVAGQKIDFGPIDISVLGQADPRTEPVPYDQLYQDVITKHTGAGPAAVRR